ncbi:metalloregulator ArsR/SmtB family transcription factor [Erwinia sp. CPCC 100877]|nr:metalloregulator ArsR/SmtB family transcription factor [Erwinia sp. CPCC 100877]
MQKQVDVFKVAELLSDQSRSIILTCLMTGERYTVNELARAAQIKQQTASYHLKKLKELHWVKEEKSGRFHYYRLVNSEVAEIIEQLSTVAPKKNIRYLSQKIENIHLYNGRTCYDHLAGKIGVAVTVWLVEKGYLFFNSEEELELTAVGAVFLSEWGIDIEKSRQAKRVFCRKCLDWSEREYHLAGSLGKELTDLFFKKNWITRHGSSRAIKLTQSGMKELVLKRQIDFHFQEINL